MLSSVNIVYLDDSKQDKIRDKKFQVIGAVIIPDDIFYDIEQDLGYYVYETVSEELLETFEFHASDLWQGNPPFDIISAPERRRLFSEFVKILDEQKISIVYGAVDLCRLYGTIYASSNVIDMAFRLCAHALEDWFMQKSPDTFGLLICDDDRTNSKTKNAITNAFRQYRHFVRGSPPERGLLAHIHDDMYFGDSKFSVGIQMADVCTFLISRHLAGYDDTEEMYKRIEPLIFRGTIEPQSDKIVTL